MVAVEVATHLLTEAAGWGSVSFGLKVENEIFFFGGTVEKEIWYLNQWEK